MPSNIKSERPTVAAVKRSMSEPCGIVAGLRPLTPLCYHNGRQMSRPIAPGEAVARA